MPDKATEPTRTTYTHEEWIAEGIRRFGKGSSMNWKFVCPCCGHIASVQDYKDAGAPQTAVAFSCIGRWLPKRTDALSAKPGDGPCNYAGGGLFQLNPVTVTQEGDKPDMRAFDFAEGTHG